VEESNNQSSDTTLNLGKILMAIDNIYSNCQEGIHKIKSNYLEQQILEGRKLEKKILPLTGEKEKKTPDEGKEKASDLDIYDKKSTSTHIV